MQICIFGASRTAKWLPTAPAPKMHIRIVSMSCSGFLTEHGRVQNARSVLQCRENRWPFCRIVL